MSELSFSIMDNNADFQQKTKQLREAIAGLETDFINLYTSAGSSIKGIEQFINELRAQIDDIILALGKIDLDNQMHLDSLQPSLLIDTNSLQGVAMQSEVSEREALSPSQRMFFIPRRSGYPYPLHLSVRIFRFAFSNK